MKREEQKIENTWKMEDMYSSDQAMDCLLYTSDAADEEDSVDLGGRRINKKKNRIKEKKKKINKKKKKRIRDD